MATPESRAGCHASQRRGDPLPDHRCDPAGPSPAARGSLAVRGRKSVASAVRGPRLSASAPRRGKPQDPSRHVRRRKQLLARTKYRATGSRRPHRERGTFELSEANRPTNARPTSTRSGLSPMRLPNTTSIALSFGQSLDLTQSPADRARARLHEAAVSPLHFPRHETQSVLVPTRWRIQEALSFRCLPRHATPTRHLHHSASLPEARRAPGASPAKQHL
jgi:hypothetical protein